MLFSVLYKEHVHKFIPFSLIVLLACIYIYIYRERERVRERGWGLWKARMKVSEMVREVRNRQKELG